jgi:hypothetical protein
MRRFVGHFRTHRSSNPRRGCCLTLKTKTPYDTSKRREIPNNGVSLLRDTGARTSHLEFITALPELNTERHYCPIKHKNSHSRHVERYKSHLRAVKSCNLLPASGKVIGTSTNIEHVCMNKRTASRRGCERHNNHFITFTHCFTNSGGIIFGARMRARVCVCVLKRRKIAKS